MPNFRSQNMFYILLIVIFNLISDYFTLKYIIFIIMEYKLKFRNVYFTLPFVEKHF